MPSTAGKSLRATRMKRLVLALCLAFLQPIIGLAVGFYAPPGSSRALLAREIGFEPINTIYSIGGNSDFKIQTFHLMLNIAFMFLVWNIIFLLHAKRKDSRKKT
jgi:hypothetical protein